MQFEGIKTPCFVVDEGLLHHNLEILKDVEIQSGAKVLLAQKAFSMFALYPMMAEYLSGTTASGLFEAKLGKEHFGKETHVFSPAYLPEDFEEILTYADHIVFNSFHQLRKYGQRVRSAGKSCAMRINPECSTQPEAHAIYDPCAQGSRLGVPLSQFEEEMLEHLDGLHFHTLCEQGFDALETTLASVEEKFGKYLHKMHYLNLGGGHHITKQDYDRRGLIDCIKRLRQTYGVEVYIEPGEAVVLGAGFLVARVLDTVHNGLDIAILNASAACHMPDVLEMPYRPPVMNAGEGGEKPFLYRLAGPTCLSGDVIGDYTFDAPLGEGDLVVFEDMALYTMVKTNTFNGMPLPSIAVRKLDGTVQMVKEFGYADFKNRLS